MRRKTTNKPSMVKILTAAATVAALSASSINVQAANNVSYFRVGLDGNDISVSTLHNAGNEAYVQSIIDAFHNANPLFINEAGEWREISERASVNDFFTDVDDVPEWIQYF